MSRFEWPYVVSEAGIVHRVLKAQPWGAYGQMVAVETVCNGWLLHVPPGSLRRHRPRGMRLCRKCFRRTEPPRRQGEEHERSREMDIMVTTPKDRMEAAAREAEDCKQAGGGFYFRRLCGSCGHTPRIKSGDRVYYVEDGAVRGFCLLDRLEEKTVDMVCASNQTNYFPGVFAFMDARTWQWIEPIPMQGFRGWRYFPKELAPQVVGGWLDPRPGIESEPPRRQGEE